MISRRSFLNIGIRSSIATGTFPLWSNALARAAFSQTSAGRYKALVVISLFGGNDSNNMLVPIGTNEYRQYSTIRGPVALRQSDLIPLFATEQSSYGPMGLHPSLKNIATRFAQKQAIVVANVGPMVAPFTKQQLLSNTSSQPESLMSHTAGYNQWLSATTQALPETGWGGRIADLIASSSGKLPPVLSTSGSSAFSVGHTVQGIAVQATSETTVAVPTVIQEATQHLTEQDMQSDNWIVSRAAQLRHSALQQQLLLSQAMASATSLQTGAFSNSAFGASMKAIAQIICGRSVIGASRQIFYCSQGNYDHHQDLLNQQAANLTDLDSNLGALMDAIDSMGLTDQVLICTHSDFNRTMQCNSTFGTDHAWGSHQLILGGGIQGGRIIGRLPTLELGGDDDLGTQGIWIPSTSVTQLAAGVGSWLGLDRAQLGQVFPNLANFPSGSLIF